MSYLFTTNFIPEVYSALIPNYIYNALHPIQRSNAQDPIVCDVPLPAFQDLRILTQCLSQYLLENKRIKMHYLPIPLVRNELTAIPETIKTSEDLHSTHNTFEGLRGLSCYTPADGQIYVLHASKNLRSLIKIFSKLTDLVPITTLTESVLSVETTIFKHKTENTYYIITDTQNSRSVTLLIRLVTLIPRMFNSLFNSDLMQDQALQQLFITLAQCTFPMSTEAADVLSEQIANYVLHHFDLRRKMIELSLQGIDTEIRDTKTAQVNAAITQVNTQIQTTQNTLITNYAFLKQQQILLAGLKYTDFAYVSSEDMDLILRLKSILTIQRNKTTLQIIWESPLNSIDLELWKKYKTSSRSTLWTENNTPWANLLYLLYEKQTYELLTRTDTTFELMDNVIRLKTIMSPAMDHTTWVPHPHLAQYRCLGDNKEAIERALRANNLLDALYQTNAATQQYNIADGTVTNTLYNDINRKQAYLKLRCKADQKFYTIAEAMKREEEEQ